MSIILFTFITYQTAIGNEAERYIDDIHRQDEATWNRSKAGW